MQFLSRASDRPFAGDGPEIKQVVIVEPIEVVLQSEAALQLLARLEQDFFARFAMIAYSTDIEVIRIAKF